MKNLTINFNMGGTDWSLTEFRQYDSTDVHGNKIKRFSNCAVRKNGKLHSLLFAPCSAIGDNQQFPTPVRSERNNPEMLAIAEKFPMALLDSLLQ